MLSLDIFQIELNISHEPFPLLQPTHDVSYCKFFDPKRMYSALSHMKLNLAVHHGSPYDSYLISQIHHRLLGKELL